jgi:prepilin-type N-terminal cleavage/methylation domain-containing protein
MPIHSAIPSPSERRGVKGFTLIELLITMAVLSILAGIAVPKLRGAIVKAEAVDVLGDMDVVKVAIINYQSDHNAWPAESGGGQVPNGLGEYLPSGFTFTRDKFTLDYDNQSSAGESLYNVGITVVTEEEELGRAVLELVGSNIWPAGGRRYTWIVDQ